MDSYLTSTSSVYTTEIRDPVTFNSSNMTDYNDNDYPVFIYFDFEKYWEMYMEEFRRLGEQMHRQNFMDFYPSVHIDAELRAALRLTMSVFLTMIISLFGSLSNIINMIVFYRQGILADNSTPTLVGLTISDFLCCIVTFVQASINIAREVALRDFREIDGNNFDVIAQVVGQPIPTFKQMTCWITAYLSFERMVCVTFPLHVKNVFSPRGSVFIVVCLFSLSFAFNFLENFSVRMEYPEEDQARLVKYSNPAVFSNDAKHIMNITSEIYEVALRPLCILLVLIFNAIIIIKVNLSKKFKKSNAPLSSTNRGTAKGVVTTNLTVAIDSDTGKTSARKVSKRQKKGVTKEDTLIRMMVGLCIIFLICYLPQTILSCLAYFAGQVALNKSYFPTRDLLVVSANFLETINSSVNILIYYTLSSKYRKEFLLLFSCFKRKS